MPRKLKVLTRKHGVRDENPLMMLGDKYYPHSSLRSPALRAEADQLLEQEEMKKKKKTSYKKAISKKMMSNY